MSRRVSWLLTEIERQADGKMSDLARCELVAEVAGHLDAAIQARMELGIEPDEAELQAVREFGAPKEYVKDLLRVHRPAPSKNIWKGDRMTMTVFWIGASGGLLWLLSAPQEFSPTYFFGWTLLSLAAFSYASFRSRCFRPLPLAKASFAAFLVTAFALTLTWHNLWVHGGMGEMPDWKASEFAANDIAALPRLDADIKLLQTGIRLHRQNLSDKEIENLPPDEAKFMTSAPYADQSLADSLTYSYVDPRLQNVIELRPVANKADAAVVWRDAGRFLLPKLTDARNNLSSQAMAINSARSSGLFSDLPRDLQETIVLVPFLFLPCAFLNCVFGWLGWLMSGYRISRRRRV